MLKTNASNVLGPVTGIGLRRVTLGEVRVWMGYQINSQFNSSVEVSKNTLCIFAYNISVSF